MTGTLQLWACLFSAQASQHGPPGSNLCVEFRAWDGATMCLFPPTSAGHLASLTPNTSAVALAAPVAYHFTEVPGICQEDYIHYHVDLSGTLLPDTVDTFMEWCPEYFYKLLLI